MSLVVPLAVAVAVAMWELDEGAVSWCETRCARFVCHRLIPQSSKPSLGDASYDEAQGRVLLTETHLAEGLRMMLWHSVAPPCALANFRLLP